MIENEHRKILIQTAKEAINHGLKYAGLLPIQSETFPEALKIKQASFVSLNLDGRLRGCIGSLKPQHSLIENVVENAHNAAFRDPRFAPVTPLEVLRIDIQIAVVGPLKTIECTSEQALLEQLKPGNEAWVLSAGPKRSTFLPSVWKTFPEPEAFLRHLKQMAGLQDGFWSDSIKIESYPVEEFSSLDLEQTSP